MSQKKELDINLIKKYLPHRYPFLLVDKILDYSNEHVLAVKNITFNEPFFQGHFPDSPVMPGVLQIEAMAQAAAFLSYDEFINTEKNLEVFFMTIDSAKFRKVVVPGDRLVIDVQFTRKKRDFWWMSGKITVDDILVCEASLSAVLRITDKI